MSEPNLNNQRIVHEVLEISKLIPGARFGTIVQAAVDTKKKQNNFNLIQVSDKEIFLALNEYKELLKEGAVKKPQND